MKWYLRASLVVFFSTCFFLTTILNAKPKDKPRYEPARDGRSGRIDIEQYYRIEDPIEAARILLEEAKLAQVDIDRKWESKPRNEVRLGSGPLMPDANDTRFFEKAARQVAASEDEQTTICVIKCNRVLTIRETAEMMSQGIRIYRGAPFYALFARVPASAARYLQGLETVDWVGELTPEMKYDAKARFAEDILFWVWTLVGDAGQCRDDLRRLGGEIIRMTDTGEMHHQYDMYTVRIAPARIPEVASLWWVQQVHQVGPSSSEGDYTVRESVREPERNP